MIKQVGICLALIACKNVHDGTRFIVPAVGVPGATAIELAGVTGKIETGPHPKATVDIADLASLKPDAAILIRYRTPCGEKSVAVPLPRPIKPNKRSEVTVEFPLAAEPHLAKVMFDPKLTGTVAFATAKLDPHAEFPPEIDLAACPDALTLDGKPIAIPPRPKVKATVAGSEVEDDAPALFITARPDQCFREREIGYGDDHDGYDHELHGANAYWLRAETYELWFVPVPESVEVKEISGGMKARAATRHSLAECEPPN